MIDDAQTEGPVGTSSAADITLPGVMRGSDLRFRSFYLPRRGRGALTMAAHTRPIPAVSTGLLTGAVIQRSMVGTMGLQVPEVLGVGQVRGSSGGDVIDFVVERMVDGQVAGVDDAAELWPSFSRPCPRCGGCILWYSAGSAGPSTAVSRRCSHFSSKREQTGACGLNGSIVRPWGDA